LSGGEEGDGTGEGRVTKEGEGGKGAGEANDFSSSG